MYVNVGVVGTHGKNLPETILVFKFVAGRLFYVTHRQTAISKEQVPWDGDYLLKSSAHYLTILFRVQLF